jgi:PAS domain S-box-containing protein
MSALWQLIPWLLLAVSAGLFVVVRRRHKKELATSMLGLQRVMQAVESASDAIGIGDINGTSVYHNRAHIALFGYSVEELNNVPGAGVLFADKAVAQTVISTIMDGRSWAGETNVVTKSGRQVPAFVRADLIRDDAGAPVGIFGVFRDITRERRLAEEAARANKLDSLGLMAGGIAHDFNNLLTVMLGEVLLAQMEPDVSDAVKLSLGEIKKVTLRAQALTARLRSFAKGEPPQMALVSLPRLIREAGDRGTKGTQVRTTYQIPLDLPQVMADETQLMQVLQNLVINAVQAMPDGGALDIRAGKVGRDLAAAQGLEPVQWLSIDVADTGSGIPAEDLGRIFEPFFTTKKTGTGLGLATCYTIIKRHGGQLKVESTVGFGTTFHLYLPAAGAAAAPALPIEGPQSAAV